MFSCCWTQSAIDVSGSVLEIRKSVDTEIIGIVSAAGLDVSLCKSSLSGPLPSEILNAFEKLSRNILPPSPKEVGEIEVQASVKTEESEAQASVKTEGSEVQATVQSEIGEVQATVEVKSSETQASIVVKDAVSQTLVGENRLEVPRLR